MSTEKESNDGLPKQGDDLDNPCTPNTNPNSNIRTLRVVQDLEICTVCRRNINAPLFSGCMNPKCPHGFEPCF